MTRDDRPNGVLLSGYYGCGNLGDDLLLTVAVEELRPTLPRARFLLRDHGDGLPSLGPDVIPTGVDAILDDQARSRAHRLIQFTRRISGLLRQCRWLIFGGGTVFHENGGLASLALQWLLCQIASRSHVRIAALGVGVGDLRTVAGRWLLRSIIGRCELFLVRDEAALRQCTGTKARLTDDLVFAWRSLTPEIGYKHPPRKSMCIGLTVTAHANAHTIDALTDSVRIWQQSGHRVVFLTFQHSTAISDETIFATINAKLASASPIEIRRPAATAQTIVNALADIDVICGMRFHGLVLATMLGRPFVGVAHDNKITEICRRFDMPCHTVAPLDGAVLARSIDVVKEKTPDRRLLDESRKLAKENFLAFASLASVGHKDI